MWLYSRRDSSWLHKINKVDYYYFTTLARCFLALSVTSPVQELFRWIHIKNIFLQLKWLKLTNKLQYTMHISKKQTNKTIIQTFEDVFICKNGKKITLIYNIHWIDMLFLCIDINDRNKKIQHDMEWIQKECNITLWCRSSGVLVSC